MIHITDKQTDKILSVIPEHYFWNDIHRKSLKENQETYDFTTFADKVFSDYLTERNRVIIPDEDNNFVEFIIENTRKYRSSNALFTDVYTTASYLELKKAKVIEPQTFANQTVSTIMSHCLANTKFQVGLLEGVGTKTLVIEEYTNPYALLNIIASEFGLEINFRIEIEGNKIVRYVDMLDRVGDWRGREVEFGVDLNGIERKEDNTSIITALMGLGPEKEDGTRLTTLVTDEDALQRWGWIDPDIGKLMHLIEHYEPTSNNTDMTLEQLTQYTRTELNKRINSYVEYSVDIADLENIPGLENKKIRFGDTIRIKDTGFNPPLYLEARVHTLERSLSDKAYKKFTLGDYREFTQEELDAVWKTLQNEINNIKNRVVYKVEIISTNGLIFKNDNISTTLEAHVYHGGIEVTDTIEAIRFRWTRISDDRIGDINWNNEHLNGSKTINITTADVDVRATFNCEILEET